MLLNIASCAACARTTQSKTLRSYPCRREVVTVPSECVCVDLVRHFPKAKGVFQFLLTYVDMATRWSEAMPLRKTTTQVIIAQIFCRNGFPTALISDNGPQFTSAQFKKFFKSQGIQHVTASPYRNGVVELLHSTLNSILLRRRAIGQKSSQCAYTLSGALCGC